MKKVVSVQSGASPALRIEVSVDEDRDVELTIVESFQDEEARNPAWLSPSDAVELAEALLTAAREAVAGA